MTIAAKYIFISALMMQNPAIEQNLIEFRDMHQSMANFAYDAGRTGYVFGPFANDLSDCLERAREAGHEVGQLRDYGIRVAQRAATVSYDYIPLSYIEELVGEYNEVLPFSCVRYTHNDQLVIYAAQ